jgi:hypothetical protein
MTLIDPIRFFRQEGFSPLPVPPRKRYTVGRVERKSDVFTNQEHGSYRIVGGRNGGASAPGVSADLSAVKTDYWES